MNSLSSVAAKLSNSGKKTAVKLVCIELFEIKLLCVLRPRFNNLSKKYVSCRVKEFTIKRHKDVEEVTKVFTCLGHKIILNKLFLRCPVT